MRYYLYLKLDKFLELILKLTLKNLYQKVLSFILITFVVISNFFIDEYIGHDYAEIYSYISIWIIVYILHRSIKNWNKMMEEIEKEKPRGD